ncbi:hypothetical protein DFJ74DRAFT_692473 [Hyaloraphidium curvatum]|nr:hypothetical protein DFJ74DRAFT_692473 [Hyaloraphidium curvatum]
MTSAAGAEAGKKRRAKAESPGDERSARDPSETPTSKSGGDADPDEKRRRFLERNRLAASKCRQKKKQWIEELERASADSRARNKQLHALVDQMREELMALKNQVLLHQSCEGVESFLRTHKVEPSAV